jgi:hypothetical protein
VLAALVDEAAAREVQVDLVEHHAEAREQLHGPERQRTDQARRETLYVGCASCRRRHETARVAKVEEIGLDGEEPVEPPAGEDFERVVAVAEIDSGVVDIIDAVDLVDGRREVADADIEALEVSA